MENVYINTLEALKIWIGEELKDEDIEFYNFMKKNNCTEIFVECNKSGGGLMGNSYNVDLKNDKVKLNFLNDITKIFKKSTKRVKGIIILCGKQESKFGNCDKDFPDLIIPSQDGKKEIMIFV